MTVLDNDYSPAELEACISVWIDHYNNERYHEAIDNVTPSDRIFGRDKEILEQGKSRDYASEEGKISLIYDKWLDGKSQLGVT